MTGSTDPRGQRAYTLRGATARAMSWMNHRFRGPFLAWALLLTAPEALGAQTAQPEPERLYRASTVDVARPSAAESRARRIDLRLEALGGPKLEVPAEDQALPLLVLELFDEETLILEATERRSLARGGYAWVGQPIDSKAGQATFVVRNGKVYGSVRRPGLNLQIRPDGLGSHRLTEHDESLWPEEADDTVPVWGLPPTPEPQAPLAAMTGNPVIDVLVVYSADARIGAGGTEAMEALIDLGELETNTSYANSNVGQRIRVVHTEEVAYTETGSSATDLSRLSGTTDGYLDSVHGLRDAYGADIVSLWLENTGCGRGYLMTTVSNAFESAAFNVCRRTCATGNLTFGHELGHNMALRHDWYVDDSTSPYVFNHGFVDLDTTLGSSFRTVMAYGNRCSAVFGSSCTRLQYFSNPDVFVGGDPTGVASGTSDQCIENQASPPIECDADNARALDSSALTVAGFRPTEVLAQISKEVDQSFVAIGDTITYTLTVKNDSMLTAGNVVIEDTVPLHTALQAGSLSTDASHTGTAAGSLITWTIAAPLDPGQTLVRTFAVTAIEGGLAPNSATVSSTSGAINSLHGSGTVSTAIWEPVACGFQDGFETGDLSHYWKVETTGTGRARLLQDLPDTGLWSAVLDDSISGGGASTAALVLSANLAGQAQAQLDFRWAEAGDENDSQDGVFIREAEGDPWVSAYPFADADDLVYQSGSLDLVQATSSNGLTLTDGFQIRFQFSDNFPFNPGNLGSSDGYSIDNVSLSCGCSYELTAATVSGPGTTLEQSACTIYAGPSYTVDGTGDLTLHSAQEIVLRNGFSVLASGELVLEIGPVP